MRNPLLGTSKIFDNVMNDHISWIVCTLISLVPQNCRSSKTQLHDPLIDGASLSVYFFVKQLGPRQTQVCERAFKMKRSQRSAQALIPLGRVASPSRSYRIPRVEEGCLPLSARSPRGAPFPFIRCYQRARLAAGRRACQKPESRLCSGFFTTRQPASLRSSRCGARMLGSVIPTRAGQLIPISRPPD